MNVLNDKELAGLLAKVKSVAVVGAVDKPGRPVDKVGRYLVAAGIKVIPVHPVRKSAWAIDAVPSLADIHEPVDVVDLFRNAKFCPEHAREVLAMEFKPKIFWMQSGIASLEAREILTDSGIAVVEDRCLMVDHARIMEKKLGERL